MTTQFCSSDYSFSLPLLYLAPLEIVFPSLFLSLLFFLSLFITGYSIVPFYLLLSISISFYLLCFSSLSFIFLDHSSCNYLQRLSFSLPTPKLGRQQASCPTVAARKYNGWMNKQHEMATFHTRVISFTLSSFSDAQKIRSSAVWEAITYSSFKRGQMTS